jgi:hypothetical protein
METERFSIGLVACAARKAAGPARARDLYVSELFRRASAYAERTYQAWFILSAQHYLVHPDERLEPYDKTLAAMDIRAREHWAAMVESSIRLGYGCMTEGRLDWPALPAPRLQVGRWIEDGRTRGIDRRVDLWFHAGAAYVTPVVYHLAAVRELPYDVHTPLAGLGIGKQLAWYAPSAPPLF